MVPADVSAIPTRTYNLLTFCRYSFISFSSGSGVQEWLAYPVKELCDELGSKVKGISSCWVLSLLPWTFFCWNQIRISMALWNLCAIALLTLPPERKLGYKFRGRWHKGILTSTDNVLDKIVDTEHQLIFLPVPSSNVWYYLLWFR
jgi:hypothetical protein